MALSIVDQGIDNSLQIDSATVASGSGILNFVRNGNRAYFGKSCTLLDCSIKLVENSSVFVEDDVRLAKIDLFAANNSHVRIGKNTWFTYQSRFYLHEPGVISIGSGCLIASDVIFTVSDMHSLIDIDSGLRINYSKDIVIEDKVWLGAEVAILKGVKVGTGSVVGFRSVVTRDIPMYCLAAGSPARVVRERVTWHGDLK